MGQTKTTVLVDGVSTSGVYGPFKWDNLIPGHLVYSTRKKGIVSVEIDGTSAVVTLAGATTYGGNPLDIDGMVWNQSGIKELTMPVKELYVSVQCTSSDTVTVAIEV